MSELTNQQWRFVKMVAALIHFADLRGYQLTIGDAYRDPRVSYGAPNSYHKRRLAVDFNLFIDGVWQQDTESHRPLGEFWMSMGGTWGGTFGDGNHYSLGE